MILSQRIEASLLGLGVGFIPIYAFSSGSIQPSHMFLLLFASLILMSQKLPKTSWIAPLSLLTVYVVIVESFYTILGMSPKYIINAAFFLFNFLVAISIYSYCRGASLKPIAFGTICAALIALWAVITSGVGLVEIGGTGRSTGTFNNPNQLGFFSVCLLSIAFVLFRNGAVSYRVMLFLFAAAIFLSVASLSKAAMIANFVTILIALKPLRPRASQFMWGLGSLALITIIILLVTGGFFDELLFMQRLSNMSMESDSSLESRGYLIFLQGNALQIIFGSGGGNVNDILGHEVHSTFGSVFNNYGILGLILFLSAFVVWAVRLWLAFGLITLVCVMGPALLYGVTHNGTRFTIFWVLFAMSLAMSDNALEGNQKAKR
jgi:hypothetical protein